MDPNDILCVALEHLMTASEALFAAADAFSDRQAEYHGDRGMGVPGTNPWIDRIYAYSKQVEDMAVLIERKYLED